MDLLIAYVVAPVVLVALAAGAGLLVSPLSGRITLGALTAPLGMSVIVAVGAVTTFTAATARATTLVVLGVAVAGWIAFTIARRRVRGDGPRDWWPVAVAVAAFALYAAPVALSGAATWAGWLKLDDTASWLGFTDWLMVHGKTLPEALSSTHERLIDVNFRGTGAAPYPTGAFPPLGVMSELTRTDPAALIHPYMSALGALLALGLYHAMRRQVATPWIRAVFAVAAAQAATLVGYVLWGGLKEILLPVLLITLAVVAADATRPDSPRRAVLLPVVTSIAFLSVTGTSGLGYVAPVLGAAVLIAWIVRRPRSGAIAAAAVVSGGLTGIVLLAAGAVPSRLALVPEIPDIGNLVRPLNPWQAVGIWIAGDFRVDPDVTWATVAFVGLAAGLAVVGLVTCVRARDWPLPLYGGASLLVVVYSQFSGGAWLAGKSMAVASPGVLAAALVGAAALARRWPTARPGWVAAAVAVVLGVVWSNALAYREVWLAPQAINAELQAIAQEFDGRGPALMTDFSTFGGRHFLRGLETEVAAELRVNRIPLRDGSIGQKGQSFDVSAFPDSTLAGYPLLVLRRSPLASRPPATYELVRPGRFYDVWGRIDGAAPLPSDVPLTGQFAVPVEEACRAIEALAAGLPDGEMLVAAARPEVVTVPLDAEGVPVGWTQTGTGAVVPHGPGAVTAGFEVAESGEYEVWIGGSFPGDLTVSVDGEPVLEDGGMIEADGSGATSLGRVSLAQGAHTLTVAYALPWWRPGVGAGPFPMGPVFLTPWPQDDSVIEVDPARAADLCDAAVEWVAPSP